MVGFERLNPSARCPWSSAHAALNIGLTALCAGSAVLGFGHFTSISGSLSSFCLAVFALSATLLIGSFEAYETQPVRRDKDSS